MAGTFPEAWEEVALVTVTKYDASSPANIECAAMTETIDIAQGDYPGESIPNLAGGRVWKQSPEEDGEITLEIYPTNASLADEEDNLGLFQAFAGGSWDTEEPIASDTTWTAGVDRSRDIFRVSIMWTDDTNCVSAESATSGTDTVALRFTAMGCRMTSHKAEFTDGILKVTATFKYPAMNKAGTVKMWKWESTDDGDTTALAALPAYDDADNWS